MIERDHQDHPDFDPFLPRVGCGVCGRNVQAIPADRQLVRAAHQATPDDQEAQALRSAYIEPMAAWSRRHAQTHTAQEHKRYASRVMM